MLSPENQKTISTVDQKGSILVGLVISMVVLAILGGGMVYLTTTSTFQELFANNHARAYYAAESGGRYALSVIRDAYATATDAADLNTKLGALNTLQYTLSNSDRFQLSALTITGGAGTPATVAFSSTGTVSSGFLQARRKINYSIQPANQTGGGMAGEKTELQRNLTQTFDTDVGSYTVDSSTGILKVTATGNTSPDRFYAYYGSSPTVMYDAWVAQGNKLSYDLQAKVRSTTSDYLAGVGFRMNLSSGDNYFLSAVFAQGSGINGEFSLPTSTDPYIVLFRNANSGNKRIIAYKQLSTADGVIGATDIFSDDMEGGDNWFKSNATWSYVTSTTGDAHSGTHAYKGLPNYSSATLSFRHYFDQTVSSDRGLVEMTYDDWTNVTTIATYSGSDITSWTPVNIDLNAVSGFSAFQGRPNVKIRFRLNRNSTSTSTPYPEWRIDDVDLRINGVSITPWPDNMNTNATTNANWPVPHVQWTWYINNSYCSSTSSTNGCWRGILVNADRDDALTSRSFSLATYTASNQSGTLRSPAINLTGYSSANLTFWHKLTYQNNSTVQVQMCQSSSCTTGGTWNTVGSYNSSTLNNDWAYISIPVTSNNYLNQSNVYVRFSLSTSSTTQFPIWFIDDVKIQSVAQLVDWSTILARITEKTVTDAYFNNMNGCGATGPCRVSDIEIFYAKPSSSGTGGNTTPLDANNSGNPVDVYNWPPTPIPSSLPTNYDHFTLVSNWNGWQCTSTGDNGTSQTTAQFIAGFLTSTQNANDCKFKLVGTGNELNAVIRTNCYLTSSLVNANSFVNRPEVGLIAFGATAAYNVYFDNFGFKLSGGYGGTDGSGTIIQSP